MTGLAVLAALVVLGIPVAVIYLLISHSGLKARIRELELRVARLSALPERSSSALPETVAADEADALAEPAEPEAETVVAAAEPAR